MGNGWVMDGNGDDDYQPIQYPETMDHNGIANMIKQGY